MSNLQSTQCWDEAAGSQRRRLPCRLRLVQSPAMGLHALWTVAQGMPVEAQVKGAHRRWQPVSTAREDVQQAGLRRDEQAVAGRQHCRTSCLQHSAAVADMWSLPVEGGREAATSALSLCRHLWIMRRLAPSQPVLLRSLRRHISAVRSLRTCGCCSAASGAAAMAARAARRGTRAAAVSCCGWWPAICCWQRRAGLQLPRSSESACCAAMARHLRRRIAGRHLTGHRWQLQGRVWLLKPPRAGSDMVIISCSSSRWSDAAGCATAFRTWAGLRGATSSAWHALAPIQCKGVKDTFVSVYARCQQQQGRGMHLGHVTWCGSDLDGQQLPHNAGPALLCAESIADVGVI